MSATAQQTGQDEPLARASVSAVERESDGAPTRIVVQGAAGGGGGAGAAEEPADAPPEEEQVVPPEPSPEQQPDPAPAPPPAANADEPRDHGVPFAPAGTGLYWPVRTRNSRGRTVSYRKAGGGTAGAGGRAFLASRSEGRRHAGIDLYGNHHDPVVACEDGVIVAFYHFYRSTYALLVQNDSGTVINYGEVEASSLRSRGLRVGSRVRAGQEIAEVGKMHVSSMLHVEMYVQGTTRNKRVTGAPPQGLLDPTRYLIQVAQSGR